MSPTITIDRTEVGRFRARRKELREGWNHARSEDHRPGARAEVASTRITVYDVLDYHKTGWHRDMIGDNFQLG